MTLSVISARSCSALALMLCFIASACSFQSPHPYKQRIINDGASRVPDPHLEMRWRQRIVGYEPLARQNLQYSQPAVLPDHSAVVVGTSDGRIMAVNTVTGQRLWATDVGARVDSSPTFFVDDFNGAVTILMGTDGGAFLALNADDGAELWRYETRSEIDGGAVVAEGRVFFQTSTDELYALDVLTGKYLWSYGRELPDYFTLGSSTTPIVHDGLVISGYADGFLVALYLDTGEEVWELDLRNGQRDFVDVDGQAVVVGQWLYAASHAGGLYALNLTDGAVRWRAEITGASTPLIVGDTLYTTTAGRYVMALNRQDGRVLWRYRHDENTPSALTRLNNYLSYGGSESGFYLVDRTSGLPLVQFDPGVGFNSPVTFDGAYLYAMSNGGTLYAFEVMAR